MSDVPEGYVSVFEREGPLYGFRSGEDAVAYAAQTDLAGRGHVGIFDVRGDALSLRAVADADLALVPTGSNRLTELQSRLAEYQRHLDVVPEAVDPVAYAEMWLAEHHL